MTKVKFPGNIYEDDQPQNAIDKLTGVTPPRKTVVPPTEPAAATQLKRNLKPVTFYLSDEQMEKLDDLVYLYNKKKPKTKQKINQQDILRHLIKHADIGSLQDL